MQIKRMLFLLLLFLAVSNFIIGQDANDPINYISPSPNAANLGIYGQIPVSAFTGIPDVSIPLYSLQEGNLSLPISLSTLQV